MLSKLKQSVSFSIFEKEEDRRMARILLSIILICWFASLLVLFIDLIWWDKKLVVPLLAGSILQFIPFSLLLQKKLSASSFVSAGIYILLVTAIATIGYGVRDYVMMAYPIIIMFAGLMLQQRGLFFSTLLTFAAFVWLIFGEANVWFIVEKSFIPNGVDLLVAGILVMITAWAVYILVANMQYGLTQTWRELANRQRAEESLLNSQQNLQALIENSDGSIWSIDSQYRLVVGNILYHRNVSAALGRKVLDGENVLALALPQEALDEWREYYDRALQGEKFSIEVCTRFTPHPLNMEYHFNPIRDEDGEITGVTIFGRDITERKHTQNALIQSEKRFKSYVQNAPNIFTIVDHENHIRYINRTEFNLPESMFIGKYIVDFVSAEYREAIKNALRQTRETAQPSSYLTTAKVEGTTSWYENHAMVIDPQNPLSDVIIISANITNRKNMEEELRESHEDFQRYFNMGMVGMAVTAPEKGWIEVNDRLCQILGYSKEELGRLTWAELTHPDDLEANLTLFNQMMEGDIDSYQLDKRYIRKDKSVVYATLFASCHRNPDGTVRHLLTSIIDITKRKQNEKLLEEANRQLRSQVEEIKQLQTELREQAIRDSLTGLYNRRYMQDVFKREFSRAEREDYPVSVIMLDMDDLKVFNDTYGHHIGDCAIQSLASRLQSMIREEDIVCRYGGDEFTVMLSKTTTKDAVKRVEEWREAMKTHPMEVEDGKKLEIMFTAGIASFPSHGTSMEEVVNYADVALYRAKARGKNCTIIFENAKSS